MKNEEVIITDDNIVLKNNTRSVVMSKSAKAITEIYSYVVSQNKGDVLDIGFGMGFSANKISELADTYTCIEINPQIYEKAKEWAKDKSNAEIIFGDWVDIIPTLNKKFDGIFFDTDHTYEQLSAELERFGHRANTWMIFHDISRFGKVLIPAVNEWLEKNPEWMIIPNMSTNECNGLLTIARVDIPSWESYTKEKYSDRINKPL